MAAPHRYYRAPATAEPVVRPARTKRTHRRTGAAARRQEAGRRRRFAVLVVVPVLLMLGSVYLHTISADLQARTADLEGQLLRARAERERLEVRVAELSSADRIRPLATERLGMRDPAGADLKVYARDREDGKTDGGEAKGGEPR